MSTSNMVLTDSCRLAYLVDMMPKRGEKYTLHRRPIGLADPSKGDALYNAIVRDFYDDFELMDRWGGETIENIAYHCFRTMQLDTRLHKSKYFTRVNGRDLFGRSAATKNRRIAFHVLHYTPVDDFTRCMQFLEYLASHLPSSLKSDMGNFYAGKWPQWTLEDPREAAYPAIPTSYTLNFPAAVEHDKDDADDEAASDDDDVEETSETYSETDDGQDSDTDTDGSYTIAPDAFSPVSSNEGFEDYKTCENNVY